MILITAVLVGVLILAGAILINVAAYKIGIATWYSYLATMRENGFLGASRHYSRSIVFLYLVYPLLLGVIAVTAHTMFG